MLKERLLRTLTKSALSLFARLLAGINIMFLPAHGGTDQRSSFIHNGLKRTFHVHIPQVPGGKDQPPLVIVLHGRGGNGESMVLVTRKGFDRLSDTKGFIVAYPDGIELNWNDGRMDEEANDRAHRENIDDVGFLSALIDLLVGKYNVDSKRVYVTGISNGAIMAYRLACEISHKIAAIAPVDGNIPIMLLHECSPAVPVSVLAINNVNDPLVPYEGGDIYSAFNRIKLGKVLSVDESIKFWADINQCSHQPAVTEEPDRDPKDGTTVKRTVYSGGAYGTEVILYMIDGGGHTWPGGFQYLPTWIIGKTSREFDASEVIWSFFSIHSR